MPKPSEPKEATPSWRMEAGDIWIGNRKLAQLFDGNGHAYLLGRITKRTTEARKNLVAVDAQLKGDLIVEAVNQHDALRAVAEAARDFVSRYDSGAWRHEGVHALNQKLAELDRVKP